MCNTRKRICGGVGVFFALLGMALLAVGWMQAKNKWDDNNCCNEGVDCGSVLTGCTPLVCSDFLGHKTAFQKDECCYANSDTGPNGFIFLYGAGALGAVLITVLVLELGDSICCECCQKCTAVILALINGVGMVFIVVLLVVLLDKSGGDGGTCPDESTFSLLGTLGITIVADVILGLGVACSIVVTFIECCCDDSDKPNAAL